MLRSENYSEERVEKEKKQYTEKGLGKEHHNELSGKKLSRQKRLTFLFPHAK